MALSTHAQKDTVPLGEVVIKASRINASSTGKKIQKFDSLTLELFKNQTLDVLLSNITPVFVKNYGSGASQTTTFRGGNASQTAILWNGLNIQNSMLGQTDLSNVAGSLFNSIDVEYGGSSALWGSGAMGGAIHLNNTTSLNKGFRTKINTLMSDIGLRSAATDIGYSNSQISFDLKGILVNSTNEYSYYKDSATIVNQKNAAYQQLSAMPQLKWFVNKNNSVQASVWLNKGLRNFPNNTGTVHNKVQQEDESQRASLNWNYSTHKIVNYVKAAYFFELLNYSDSLAAIDSRADMETRIIEDDLYLTWKEDHTLNFGFNYTKNEGRTTNYNGTKFIEKYAFVLGHRDVFMNGKLTTNLAARLEHTSSNLNPITYNFGADYVPVKNVVLKLNLGKVYRIPTLNDLYWTPGGDPNLKPEEGYTADGTAQYSHTKNKINIIVSGSAFYKIINNWIQWVPSGVAGYKPINLQEVNSRGTETAWQIAYNKNKFTAQLKCITSYVLSTVNKTLLEGDETLNKQLIYTPRYTVNSSVLIRYGTFAISYFHNYVGYRFTASDNSAWLKPYHYSTLRTTFTYPYKSLDLGLFANINNVLNKNYVVLQNMPQPLRYFELGIQLNYKTIKKTDK